MVRNTRHTLRTFTRICFFFIFTHTLCFYLQSSQQMIDSYIKAFRFASLQIIRVERLWQDRDSVRKRLSAASRPVVWSVFEV